MSQMDMNCHDFLSMLSELIDNEVADQQAARAKQHLRRCATCRAAYDDLTSWDGQLRERLAPDGAERTVAAVTAAIAHTSSAASPVAHPSSSRSRWFIAAACATAALVVVLIWPSNPPDTRPLVAAEIVMATGAIEYQAPAGDWQLLSVSRPLPMAVGSRLRTAEQSLCEIRTPNQGTLRLNNASEVIIHNSEHVELVQGQVWCRAPSKKPLKVEVPMKADPQHDDAWSMDCTESAEFQWSVGEGKSEFSSLDKNPAMLSCGPFVCPVDPGKAVVVESNKPVPTVVNGVDDVAAILWQLPLLHREEAISDELHGVLESVLSRIGQTKASYMYENQIRALGAPGAAPLLAYVRSDRSLAAPAQRHWAMRIASEMADTSLLSWLNQLSNDDDEQIRQYANRAIARIGEQQQH